ncbi:MAG: formate dehydrogenase accessory sulfurtransferase FdhD [Bryobacteraceae bacterium]|nr:formate dehydrogenase accessory sulfurtransferase FdhD [Bryobacteraceae bacterium]
MRTEIVRYRQGSLEPGDDILAIEEPLEIRIGAWRGATRVYRNAVVTMRTPGDDAALAAGFLFTEGILTAPAQIDSIAAWDAALPNVWRVDLAEGVEIDWKRLERLTYAASSCGMCGKASIEQVAARLPEIPLSDRVFDAETLLSLPARLAERQPGFTATGAVHAAALFSAAGEFLASFEDVGRHNAVDKLIGDEWLAGRSLGERILLVSGRAGFELVQKAAMARVPLMAAVGAPSSLAVELAESAGMTLVGFLRDGRFNIYSGAQRIRREALS